MTEVFGDPIGVGKQAEVFANGTLVTKLYNAGVEKHAAFREAGILAVLEELDLPAPRVAEVRRYGERWGVTMTRAPGKTFASAMQAAPRRAGPYLDALVALQRMIHARPGVRLPMLRARLASRISGAGQLDAARRAQLLARLAALPDGDRLCHGDYHPFNVMGTPDDAMVVDWMDAAMGPPEADLCRSWVLVHPVAPQLADAHLDAYVAGGGATREAVFAWRPIIAAARLAEDVPDEVPALMAMVEAS